MNLHELFAAQKKLDAGITAHHPALEGENRLEKKVLALLVELGECANEWRGFKFWSNRQKPNDFKREHCPECFEKGYYRGNPPKDEKKGVHGLGNHWYHCEKCSGFLVVDKNPLLEEYVDVLHFALSIGNDLGISNAYITGYSHPSPEFTPSEITIHFALIYNVTTELMFCQKEFAELNYRVLLKHFELLGRMLGFSWEQVEAAYYAKNKINHNRQRSGY